MVKVGINLMKKLLTIKYQKIISFIPIINYSIIFIWLYNYSHTSKNIKVLFKSLLITFMFIICLAVIYIILEKFFAGVSIFIKFMDISLQYVLPLVVGMILIKCEEKMF